MDEKDTAEADRRSAAEFYRYQVTTASNADNTPNFTGVLAVRIPADDSPISHTAPGLTAATYYFRVQAGNIMGDGAWSEASAGATVPRVPADGGWTYRLDISRSTITPGSATGASVSLVATFEAALEDMGDIVTLSASSAGTVAANVPSESPQSVGFGDSPTGTLSATSQARGLTSGSCTSDPSKGSIECTIPITSESQAIFAAEGTTSGNWLIGATLYSFSMTAIINGIGSIDSPVADEVTAGSIFAGNRPPVAQGTISNMSFIEGDAAKTVDVTAYFNDLENDVLIYGAESDNRAVATVSVTGSSMMVSSGIPGEATITVTATDEGGSGQSAEQSFTVTVEASSPPKPSPTPPPRNRAPEVEGSIRVPTMTEDGRSKSIDLSSSRLLKNSCLKQF